MYTLKSVIQCELHLNYSVFIYSKCKGNQFNIYLATLAHYISRNRLHIKILSYTIFDYRL